MTLNHLSDSAAVTLRGLAAAAGVAELADGAAVDAAEGDDFLAGLARHEIALGHQLVMALAAAGNGALDRAAAAPGAVPGAAPETGAGKADLAAGRFGGGVARLSGHLRQSVRLLQRQPAAADARWVGLHFADEPLCSPEEEARRLAAAKAAAAAARPSEGETAARRRAADAAELARLAAAARAAGALASAGTDSLAGTGLGLLLRHQLAAGHRLMMRLGGRALQLLNGTAATGGDIDSLAALRLASVAGRLMARGRQTLAMLPSLNSGPNGAPGGGAPGGGAPGGGAPGDGNGPVAGFYWRGERDFLAGGPAAAAVEPPAAPKLYAVPGQPRGRLANGNPCGDFLAARRCGACTRAGTACRQPAMPNGRCRFHGGKSTGPRTAAGRARSRAARLTHGFHSAEIIHLHRAAAACGRRLRHLTARLRPTGVPAGHGVDPQISPPFSVGPAGGPLVSTLVARCRR